MIPGMANRKPVSAHLGLQVCTTASLLLLISCGLPNAGPGDHEDGVQGPTIDEPGFLLNDPESERHTSAACPKGGNVNPATPNFGASCDGKASYVAQSKCSASAKPGVTAFKNLVLKTYPCTHSGGIVRGCSVGGKSEHKEGRAWDWMVNYPHPAATKLLAWLLATDKHGNKYANARRLGIMYMIWNRKIWGAYNASAGWRPYTGSNPHTDHVHFSFSWKGANKQTSFWSATAPPPSPPPALGTPLMSIATSVATISGQKRDFCARSSGGFKSAAIYDFKKGQTTTVYVDVKNSGGAVAKNVRVGIWTEQPYLLTTKWNIYSNWKTTGFKLNDTDGLQAIAHTNPPKTFTLAIGAMSPGETKRVKLTVRAAKASYGVVHHPDIRAWVSHVDNYYEKASFYASFNNVQGLQKQNGGDLRHYVQTDVIGAETCDTLDNDCDGSVDEGNVCGSTTPADPPPPAPEPDAGVPAGDAGGFEDTPGAAPDAGPGGGFGSDASLPPPAQGSPDGIQLFGTCSAGGSLGAGAGTALPLLLLLSLVLVARRSSPRHPRR
jgi:hypothetical protein